MIVTVSAAGIYRFKNQLLISGWQINEYTGNRLLSNNNSSCLTMLAGSCSPHAFIILKRFTSVGEYFDNSSAISPLTSRNCSQLSTRSISSAVGCVYIGFFYYY